jgi:hypothetical protein
MIADGVKRSLAKRLAPIPRSRALVVLAMVAIVACTGRESSASGESAATVQGPEAQAHGARGHLQLTGDATVDTDFAVEQCTIGPAGDGPLNGYRMSAKPAHGTVQMLSVNVRDYVRDSTYAPPVDTGKSSFTSKRGVSEPLAMTIGRENSTVPLPVMTRPESRLTITISDSGSRGSAEFTDLTSPLAMEDIAIKSHPHAKGKTFSGSLSWHCASVERVDSASTNAAKSLLKGLTPVH